MTREEAINRFKGIKKSFSISIAQSNFYPTKDIQDELCDMAIEALLSEPSGDLISRQWLLDLYGDYIGDNGDTKYHVPLEVVRQNIKDAPSVSIQPKAIVNNCDLISRQDAIKAVLSVPMPLRLADEIDEVLRSLPSADRPKGEWIVENHEVVCSICGQNNLETDFCPNCGADMRGDETNGR